MPLSTEAAVRIDEARDKADLLVAKVLEELVKIVPNLVDEAQKKHWSHEKLAEIECLAGGLV